MINNQIEIEAAQLFVWLAKINRHRQNARMEFTTVNCCAYASGSENVNQQLKNTRILLFDADTNTKTKTIIQTASKPQNDN